MVGGLGFCAKFVRLERGLLNPSYASVASAHHLHCRQDRILVTHEMFANIMTLHEKLRTDQWASVVVESWFNFPERETFSSDATCPIIPAPTESVLPSADGELCVHVFGSVASGRWSKGIREFFAARRLSISLLELLSVAAMVALIGQCS